MRRLGAVLLLALVAGCARGDGDGDAGTTGAARVVPVTIAGPGVAGGGRHVFRAEVAATAAQQERGLMYRTDLTPDGGMLFAPYPPGGGRPAAANFWMKNTPTPLDIVFIRADGTIAHIAENTIPMSETIVPSGEPVAAVLELVGGRTAETGVSEGDRVSWPGR
ncbi:DUF192 domain-containing protein [Sphingomonas sp.]|uniref:DUF192 domain-containing protein n=1 Tax=Sphingomonas sp. TaxID=28214 RepID=UPI003CC58068